MEERMGEAFAGTEQLTVIGRQLQAGDPAPDFRLDYFDLADLAVHTISLADSTGLVRLLNVVNTIESPRCQQVIKQWETLRVMLPPDTCIYTVSMDPPQLQARWQDTVGVLHQILSAQHSEQFGQTMGCGSRSGGSSHRRSLCLIATTASSTPSTLLIGCMSQTMQRPYKRFSGPRRNEGPKEVTPDHPGEGATHQLEHKEHHRDR